jgi:hypothetical protein
METPIYAISPNDKNALKKMLRLNTEDRIRSILYILDNTSDIIECKKLLLNFTPILLLIKRFNKKSMSSTLSSVVKDQRKKDEILIKNTLQAMRILTVLRRDFICADGIIISKDKNLRESRSLDEKKKIIRDKVGEFTDDVFEGAYNVYIEPK